MGARKRETRKVSHMVTFALSVIIAWWEQKHRPSVALEHTILALVLMVLNSVSLALQDTTATDRHSVRQQENAAQAIIVQVVLVHHRPHLHLNSVPLENSAQMERRPSSCVQMVKRLCPPDAQPVNHVLPTCSVLKVHSVLRVHMDVIVMKAQALFNRSVLQARLVTLLICVT